MMGFSETKGRRDLGGERRGEERREGGSWKLPGLIHSKQNKPDVSLLAKKFKIK
jgi:hypothetical protein